MDLAEAVSGDCGGTPAFSIKARGNKTDRSLDSGANMQKHRIVMWTTALGMVLATNTASPVIMRHDVEEKQFLSLAKQYLTTASVRPADSAKGLGGEGTLIAPLWVLTAAHVAAELGPDDLVEVNRVISRIDRVFLHPEWHQESDLKQDIALIRLKSAIKHVRIAELYSEVNEVGLVATLVGRGGTGTGLTGPSGEEDRRIRAATNRVEGVDGPFIKFRFDGPDDATVTQLEGISGPGDSGGPAYVEQHGKLYVIGVSSWQDTKPTGRQEGRYGVFEYYCRVSFFLDWIRKTLQST